MQVCDFGLEIGLVNNDLSAFSTYISWMQLSSNYYTHEHKVNEEICAICHDMKFTVSGNFGRDGNSFILKKLFLRWRTNDLMFEMFAQISSISNDLFSTPILHAANWKKCHFLLLKNHSIQFNWMLLSFDVGIFEIDKNNNQWFELFDKHFNFKFQYF